MTDVNKTTEITTKAQNKAEAREEKKRIKYKKWVEKQIPKWIKKQEKEIKYWAKQGDTSTICTLAETIDSADKMINYFRNKGYFCTRTIGQHFCISWDEVDLIKEIIFLNDPIDMCYHVKIVKGVVNEDLDYHSIRAAQIRNALHDIKVNKQLGRNVIVEYIEKGETKCCGIKRVGKVWF